MNGLNKSCLNIALLGLLIPGCASLKHLSPPSLLEHVEALRDTPMAVSPLSSAVAAHTQGNPLLVQEKTLAEIPLGMTAEALRTRWGNPRSAIEQGDGWWWSFKGHAQTTPSVALRVQLKRGAAEPAELKVTQIQAWWPSRHLTRTLIRPFDPAARVLRKYGPPEQLVPWGLGQAWVYPTANVAFIVTRDVPPEERVVAGIVVGL